jgi:uncharacterized membrane protein
MATLAAWRFTTPDGAERARRALRGRDLGDRYDAAVVEWPSGQRRPRTRTLTDTSETGALDDNFWGLLFGLVFFVPLLGAAIGATTGALAGALTDVGIDDHFINRLRDQVIPGTSALFLLASPAVIDQVQEALGSGPPVELIATGLDDHQTSALRQVFGTRGPGPTHRR